MSLRQGVHITQKELSGHHELKNDPINDPIKLTVRENDILNLLREEPTLTYSAMAEKLMCSESTVKRTLQLMAKKGIIKRIGSNKKGEWILV